MTNVTHTTDIEFTAAAWENLEECAVDVDTDLATVKRKGQAYKSDFLAHCLNGADADREQGWRDYVDALFDAAFRARPRTGDRAMTYAVVTDVTPNRCTIVSLHDTRDAADSAAETHDTGINGMPAEVMETRITADGMEEGDRAAHADGICWTL